MKTMIKAVVLGIILASPITNAQQVEQNDKVYGKEASEDYSKRIKQLQVWDKEGWRRIGRVHALCMNIVRQQGLNPHYYNIAKDVDVSLRKAGGSELADIFQMGIMELIYDEDEILDDLDSWQWHMWAQLLGTLLYRLREEPRHPYETLQRIVGEELWLRRGRGCGKAGKQFNDGVWVGYAYPFPWLSLQAK